MCHNIAIKIPNMKCKWNLSSGHTSVQCWWTDGPADRQTWWKW